MRMQRQPCQEPSRHLGSSDTDNQTHVEFGEDEGAAVSDTVENRVPGLEGPPRGSTSG